MDFASLKAALNKLFGAIGMSPLADAVDEASIVLVVEDRAASLGGETAPEETPAEGTTASDGQTPPMDGAGMNNARRRKVAQQVDIAAIVQQAISPLAQKVAALSNSMSLMKGGAANHAQAAFEAKCGELGKLGVAAATLQEKRELAGAMGWDIRLLNGLQPSVAMSNTSQKGATNQPPPNGTNPGGDALTNDQMEARLKARGIDPKLMPQ